jgi:hypothetical protein
VLAHLVAALKESLIWVAAKGEMSVAPVKMTPTAAPTPRFVAISALSDAAEYGFAARILYESQHTRVASPQYLVISQAIELYLKAFIVIHSGSADVVQRPGIRHNLQGLLAMAEKLGFAGCSQEARDLIVALQPLHKTHYFRYRNTTRAQWPSVRVAVETLDGFAKAISRATSRQINSSR